MSIKRLLILSVVLIFTFAGCDVRKREIEVEKRTAELNETEQQLALKEQSLEFREQLLIEREKILDSTSRKIANDSMYLKFPQLPGTWNVKMICKETSCSGSAVGDVKTEQWNFSFQDNMIIATAVSNDQMVRVYSGQSTGNTIRLMVQQDSTDNQTAKMTVRLQNITDKEIDGEREIIQSGGCRIVYSLQLRKQ